MLSDHYRSGMTERLIVRILTVDPSTQRVEVIGKDAAVIQIGVGQTPPLFICPVQNDFWTIVRENGGWSLENRITGPDDKQLSTLNPGEALIQAETIWTPSGEYLVKSNAVNALDARLDAIEARRVVDGTIAADGLSHNGTGFSVVRNATGDYTVTFTPVFNGIPNVILSSGSTAAYYSIKQFNGAAPTASGFRVLSFNPSTLASVDGIWSFIARGPS